MQVELDGDRLLVRRDPEQKQPLHSRLARVEGQVRGLREMIESDRYCGEIVQQTSAIKAALREVALLCVQDHLAAGIEFAATAKLDGDNGASVDTAVAEITSLLRALLKQ